VVMIVPINAKIDEAKKVAEKNRHNWQ